MTDEESDEAHSWHLLVEKKRERDERERYCLKPSTSNCRHMQTGLLLLSNVVICLTYLLNNYLMLSPKCDACTGCMQRTDFFFPRSVE